MEISYAFFAEAAQITSDGRVNILGADLSTVYIQGQPPWTATPLSLLVSIVFEPEDCGRLYHFMADLITPDGRTIEPHFENHLVAPAFENADTKGKFSIVLQLVGTVLPMPGVYQLQVRIEDRDRNITLERRVGLRVTEGASQKQPA